MIMQINDNVAVGDKFTLIAGPCMAESYDICRQSAEFLIECCRELDINYIFKASFDKANRSSGSTTRGPGLKKGLEFIRQIKSAYHVPVLTDVHECCQGEAVAEVADILQIPAFLCRQTDLLHAAADSGRVVNIKKGQFMAPEDMGGAIKKVQERGNNRVMLTERGFAFGYHNLIVDMRSLAIMRGFGVPVVFDATHSVQLPGGLGNASGGQRQFIRPLARAAAGVGIDLLFAEVHPNPEAALSDGPNSLNFDQARQLLQEVKVIYDLVKQWEK